MSDREQKKLFHCPRCDWTSGEFDPESVEKLFREVDAEMHFMQEHPGEELEPDAEFGRYQCPSCLRMDGMDSGVSCKHCGHIPEEARA